MRMPEWVRTLISHASVYARIFVLLIVIGAVCTAALATVFALPAFFQPRHIELPSTVRPMPAPQAGDRILLVAAHPDDEFLSAAGYLREAVRNRAQVFVALMTNGEASLIAETLSRRTITASPSYYIQEGNARRQETLRALESLGVSDDHVYFLGYPTRGLRNLLFQNWPLTAPFVSEYTRQTKPVFDGAYDPQAVYTGQSAVTDLARIMESVHPSVILTHSRYDENEDHQAVYYFAQKALQQADAQSGALFAASTSEYYFLVHYRQYSFPGVASFRYALLPPVDFADASATWYDFALSQDDFVAKQSGMREYKTQFSNPYLKLLLNSFIKKNELFYTE